MNQTQHNSCARCTSIFEITEDDFAFYEKIAIPPPTQCPDCRLQRRLSWRNDFVFYNRTCDSCERNIISSYSPDNPQIIYCNRCWWGDGWDPKSYAQEFDFGRPFFEQFAEFRECIPALALINDNGTGSVNSEYMQNVQYSKNCYMAMVAWKLENCLYFSYGADAKDAVDCMGIFGSSEGIYEVLYSDKCYGSRYLQQCEAMSDSIMCRDCRGCEHCFMCTGLRNQKYCFQNQQYSAEDYQQIVDQYQLHTRSGTQQAQHDYQEFLTTQPREYASLKQCVNCTGTNLMEGKNSQNIFHVRRPEDSKFIENGDTIRDSYDLCVGGELEQCYEGLTPDHSQRALFISFCWKCSDVLYSDFCMSSHDCFGCVGLRHAQYCILNKQYSKAEYYELKQQIIDHMIETGEWGEFFPLQTSPYAYNESMAQVSFPLTKDQALAEGLGWQDNVQMTTGKTTLAEIPDSIDDVSDAIIDEILECNSCQRNYKIVPDELVFYRRWRIPVPDHCFFCRLGRRFLQRGPSQLVHEQCQCIQENHDHVDRCSSVFMTTYNPENDALYCTSCYQKSIL